MRLYERHQTANCVVLSPRRRWVRKIREGSMLNPRFITALPHFFSDSRVSLAGRNWTTFEDVVFGFFAMPPPCTN